MNGSFDQLVNSGLFHTSGPAAANPGGALSLTELTMIPQASMLTALPRSPFPPAVVPFAPGALPAMQPLMFTVPPTVAMVDPWAQAATPFMIEQIQAASMLGAGVVLQPLALVGERC